MRFRCVPPSASPRRRKRRRLSEKAKRDRRRFDFERQ
jgi:hypothetical protein